MKGYWQLQLLEKEESFYLKEVASGTHDLMDGPMPIYIWAALNGLIGCLKRETEHEVLGEICWKKVQKLHGEGYDHNPSYTCMNF